MVEYNYIIQIAIDKEKTLWSDIKFRGNDVTSKKSLADFSKGREKGTVRLLKMSDIKW